ncbi:MAG: calcium/sodium antiporter [Cyclobacteriaceae bacterium]|nr:calcium/sodium antiporter [Cyclobacteriaceae bacterium]
MWELLYLIFGLLGLWLGTELVIRGALTIAEHYDLSQVFIGLTILAIGTDLPELMLSIDASLLKLKGVETSGLIVGNALGSCLNQITLVMGIAGIMGYITLSRKSLKQDGLVLLGSIVLFFLVSYDLKISRIEGITLVVVYVIYYLMLLYGEKLPERLKKELPQKIWQNLVFLLGGIVLVIVASDMVINNGLKLAELWGVSQSFIGIVFIAFGTSLPELVLSIGAALKKATGLSVGNIIGSNIFDILIPAGVGATISEIKVEKPVLHFDTPILFVVTAIVLIYFYKKKGLQKKEAVSLVAVYVIYIILKSFGF